MKNERPNSRTTKPRKGYRKPTLVKYGDLGSVTRGNPEGAGELDGGGTPIDPHKTS